MARVELAWNPFNLPDPGPCIDVLIANPRDVIERGRAVGLEYPEPRPIRALLDTGASVTVISKAFANHCRLLQTNEGAEITAVGATHSCGEHAATISFPGTDLTSLDTIRVVSADFLKQPYYACLIGRDVLRNWVMVFDGRAKLVTITD